MLPVLCFMYRGHVTCHAVDGTFFAHVRTYTRMVRGARQKAKPLAVSIETPKHVLLEIHMRDMHIDQRERDSYTVHVKFGECISVTLCFCVES